MMLEALKVLYEYNRLATERLLVTAGQLPVEQLLAPQTAGRGSIRDTLAHMIGAQLAWLTIWEGSAPPVAASPASIAPETDPDLPTLRVVFRAVDRATRMYLADLQESDLAEVVTRTRPSGVQVTRPLWQLIIHVVNHGTQHRSEVAAMLTAFGHSPGELGMMEFLPS